MEELLLKARKKKTPATQQAVAQEAAGVVDEDVVEGAVGAVDQAAAAKEKPKKFCWNCQTPGHAVELKKCSGCKRVSSMNLYCLSPENWLFDGIFGGHKDGLPHTLVPLLAH